MGDKEATELHALLPVCDLSNRSGTHHQRTLKDVMTHTCYLCNDIHAEDLAVKFVLYPLTVHVWWTLTFQLSCWGTALLS